MLLFLPNNAKISLLMKFAKTISITFILALLLFILSFAPVAASAASASDKSYYRPSHGGYTLVTLTTSDGKPTGVRYSGYYFGGDIVVTADIYSSAAFAVDFYINDDAPNYTQTQREQRLRIIRLAESVHNYINEADSLANTQYDGVNGRPLSDVYRYNSAAVGTKLAVDKMTYEMLLVAKEMYRDTNGAFNPAVYRLVDLWGFSSRIYSNGNFGLPYDRQVTAEEFWDNGYPLPEQKYVDAFSSASFTDFSDQSVTLSAEDGKYYVTKNVRPAVVGSESYEQWLDLGGIAKGYVADGIKAMFSDEQIDRYNVDVGSSSMVFGLNYNGGDNVMTIPDPFDPKSVLGLGAMVSARFGKSSVSTSGQYIRKYTVDGVEYSHIIDGFTGAPAQTGVKLVTVIAPDDGTWAGKGDCLTTALTVMGREKIVEFMNGYLKDNGIDVFVLYQAVDGSKQILSNMDQSALTKVSDNYDDYVWSVDKTEDGAFVYNGQAKLASDLTWLVITLGVLVGLCVVGVIVYYYIRGRRSAIDNVKYARRDKPFKTGDIVIYVSVALVIAVLFLAFFTDGGEEKITVVKVIDMQTQEVLFAYNVARDDYVINANERGWEIAADKANGKLTVTFSKDFDGDRRFDEMTITTGGDFSVKMTNSVCGFHQECVKNFPAITRPNGSIVCSPNRLKIITE